MKRTSAVIVATLAVLFCLCFNAAQSAQKSLLLDDQVRAIDDSKAVPGQLNYQGYLVNAADSSAVNATLGMTFRLFDAPSSGIEQWSETHAAVQLKEGLFSVLLGSVTPFPAGLFDGADLWLQTEVGAEILSPRKPLVSVAYSHRANSAEKLLNFNMADLDDRWVNEGQANSVTSDMVVDGAGSGLDADMVDGQQAADFISMGDLDHLDAADGAPQNAVYVDNAGQVGVGTTSPGYPLDVNGAVNATTYYGDGSNLTNISGTTDNDWIISGSDMYSNVSGSVGIGTASPEAKLHVVDGAGKTAIVAKSADTTAIVGITESTTGPTYGGYFVGNSHWGGGVYSVSERGTGIRGLHTDPSFTSPGVYGENTGSGVGVLGDAVDGDGVRGRSDTGNGVYGQNMSKGAYGILGTPTHAGHFEGDVYISGATGIGITTPSQELHVHGEMPQLMLSNTWNSHWMTVGTGAVGISFDSDYGTEPFVVDYNAPSAALYVHENGGCILGGWGPPQAGLEIYSDIADYELWLTELDATGDDHSQIHFDADSTDYDMGVNSGTGIFYLWQPGTGDALDISASEYWIDLNYDTQIGGNLTVNGDLQVYGATKNFVQDDPTDPSQMIVYACLEGPEPGTYVRGSARLRGGQATIELPEHFAKVTAQEELTIQLTPDGQWLELYVVEKDPAHIVVAEANSKDGDFDYLVQGIRQGYEDYRAVRDRSEFPALERMDKRSQYNQQGGPVGTTSPKPTQTREKTRGNLPQEDTNRNRQPAGQ